MHICFICNEYPGLRPTYGGVGTFTRTLGRALVKSGHRVTVLGCYPNAGVSEDQGVRVVQVRAPQMRGLGVWATALVMRHAVAQAHNVSAFDIVEGPELSLFWVPSSLSAVKVIRMQGGHHFFYTSLGMRPRRWRGWVERRSFANADALAAVSQYVATTTLRLLNLGDRSVTILPNPVDTDAFRPDSSTQPIPARVLFVGTLCEKKGIRQLVQALPAVFGRVPGAHLVALGRDSRDPATGASYLETLRQNIPESIAGRVHFPGPVPNDSLPQELARAAVCVYPSHMEAQGIVVCEGMAVARPVIASATGPGPELVEDGVSGLLCNPYDPADIAEKIVRILSCPADAEAMGRAARQRAERLFSVGVLVKRNVEFYQHCLRQPRRPRTNALRG